ncbi:hypothetical protein CEXT_20291 [Caerostris extrusa]|uniref:Uncharacterized protein n=1 Tax=Caerostris extrusa TaxID=172846 RepID=A0AAV4TGN7_CAEEX|nr:hypothetical protein CEXT_20291 [Caerostris extrusa]
MKVNENMKPFFTDILFQVLLTQNSVTKSRRDCIEALAANGTYNMSYLDLKKQSNITIVHTLRTISQTMKIYAPLQIESPAMESYGNGFIAQSIYFFLGK